MEESRKPIHPNTYGNLAMWEKLGLLLPQNLTQHNHQMGQRFRGERKQSLEKWEKFLCSQRGKEGLSKYDTQKRKWQKCIYIFKYMQTQNWTKYDKIHSV